VNWFADAARGCFEGTLPIARGGMSASAETISLSLAPGSPERARIGAGGDLSLAGLNPMRPLESGLCQNSAFSSD